MYILAFVSEQHAISRILEHVGLRSSQQDKPPPAREILRVAEAGEDCLRFVKPLFRGGCGGDHAAALSVVGVVDEVSVDG